MSNVGTKNRANSSNTHEPFNLPDFIIKQTLFYDHNVFFFVCLRPKQVSISVVVFLRRGPVLRYAVGV